MCTMSCESINPIDYNLCYNTSNVQDIALHIFWKFLEQRPDDLEMESIVGLAEVARAAAEELCGVNSQYDNNSGAIDFRPVISWGP